MTQARGDSRAIAAEERYWVFGRLRPGEPLLQIGMVKASSPRLAYVYARQNYTERPLTDLCVAPRSAFFFEAETEPGQAASGVALVAPA